MQITRYEYTCTTCGFCERLNNENSDWKCKRCNAKPGIRYWQQCSKHGTHIEGKGTCKDCEELSYLKKLYSKTSPFSVAAEAEVIKEQEEASINNVWAKKLEQKRQRKKELEDSVIETPKLLKKLVDVMEKNVQS